MPQWSSPVAFGTEAGVAIDLVQALGPVLAAVSPTVILVLAAVVPCVARGALTPGRGVGVS